MELGPSIPLGPPQNPQNPPFSVGQLVPVFPIHSEGEAVPELDKSKWSELLAAPKEKRIIAPLLLAAGLQPSVPVYTQDEQGIKLRLWATPYQQENQWALFLAAEWEDGRAFAISEQEDGYCAYARATFTDTVSTDTHREQIEVASAKNLTQKELAEVLLGHGQSILHLRKLVVVDQQPLDEIASFQPARQKGIEADGRRAYGLTCPRPLFPQPLFSLARYRTPLRRGQERAFPGQQRLSY